MRPMGGDLLYEVEMVFVLAYTTRPGVCTNVPCIKWHVATRCCFRCPLPICDYPESQSCPRTPSNDRVQRDQMLKSGCSNPVTMLDASLPSLLFASPCATLALPCSAFSRSAPPSDFAHRDYWLLHPHQKRRLAVAGSYSRH
jgi:hypothetical protein